MFPTRHCEGRRPEAINSDIIAQVAKRAIMSVRPPRQQSWLAVLFAASPLMTTASLRSQGSKLLWTLRSLLF